MTTQKKLETRYLCVACGYTHYLKDAFLEIVIGYDANNNPVRRLVCKCPCFRSDGKAQDTKTGG